MNKRLWETEKFTLNLATGALVRSVTTMFIEAENFEHAHNRLLQSGMVWLRLTGNWFTKEVIMPEYEDETNQDAFDDAFNLYKKPKKEPKTFDGFDIYDYEAFMIDPVRFLGDFNLDQLFDWLDSLEHSQVKSVWEVAVKNQLHDKTSIIEGFMSYKYGDKL